MPINNQIKKIIFVGGGTGGHIVPLLVISESLIVSAKQAGITINSLFLGTPKSIEEKVVSDADFLFQIISAGKWRRYAAWKNFTDLFLTIKGICQSFIILRKFRPDLVFAKGGYVSFPVIVAAILLGMPIFIHESDSVMGWVNKIAMRWVKKIFTGFPGNFYPAVPKEKLIFSGIPIRENFFKAGNRAGKKPLILVMGGSQGSQQINLAIKEILPEILEKFAVIHFTGPPNLTEFLKLGKVKNYQVLGSVPDPWKYMRKADLIISRAGASSLAEIAALGKPAILVPLTLAASDHQAQNADYFYSHKAAEVIAESDLIPAVLLEKINHILGEKKLSQEMRENAKILAKPDAAKIIVKEIISFLSP